MTSSEVGAFLSRDEGDSQRTKAGGASMWFEVEDDNQRMADDAGPYARRELTSAGRPASTSRQVRGVGPYYSSSRVRRPGRLGVGVGLSPLGLGPPASAARQVCCSPGSP